MGTNSASRKTPLGRTKSEQHISSNGKTRKSAQEKALQRSFLTHTFDTLPVFEVNPVMLDFVDYRLKDGEPILTLVNHRIDIQSNIIKLRKGATAYCKAFGVNFCNDLPEDPLKQLHYLYQMMNKCKPQNNKIGLDFNRAKNELEFLEFIWCDYPSCTIAYVTVSLLDKLKDPYRQFFKEFMSLMVSTMNMPSPIDSYDFAAALGWFDEDWYEEEIKNDEEYKEMAKSYKDGHVHELIKEVKETPWHFLSNPNEEFENRLNSLLDNSPIPELRELIEVCIEGIDLMKKECISSYQYNLDHCEIPEFDTTDSNQDEFLPIERVLGICYGDENKDVVVERTIDILNTDASNYMEEELYEVCVIEENYKPSMGSQFPNRWFEWFAKYNTAKWKYESAYTNGE